MGDKKLAEIIIGEMAKYASKTGSYSGTMQVDLKNTPLTINGQQQMCSGIVEVNATFDWYKDYGDYDNPPEHTIDNLDFDIVEFVEFIVEADPDTYYTEEQQRKIINENYDTIKDAIYSEVEDKAYEADTNDGNAIDPDSAYEDARLRD